VESKLIKKRDNSKKGRFTNNLLKSRLRRKLTGNSKKEEIDRCLMIQKEKKTYNIQII